ncbi:MraY family glycosyltransferase [Paenibacillus turpanensis]|uniref:MraY family glycosyltransferase n=1 Tax=Paenibacillus turpanensis TaxID=2689078 RepID=UPI00140A2296|nr:MraY family glycosyltransferase [Paenibacillus turpanensis]
MEVIVPFAFSLALVLLLVPAVRRVALETGFFDKPTGRKIHSRPIPLMGGAAIFAGAVISLLLFEGWTNLSQTIVYGGAALVVTGLVDDWHKSRGLEFPVWPRLLIYSAVSAIPLVYGIEISGISRLIGGGMHMFPEILVIVGTMLWVFAFINMINFIDGLDGLASGISAISSTTLLIVAVWSGQRDSALLAAVLAGACIAFLAFNFHPAKIFMGDAGATFLGYALAVLAIEGAFKSATVVSVLVPVFALGVPIMDTVFVFTRRFLERRGLHKADKLHTHHSLMKSGLSHRQTVSFLYLIGTVFSLVSIILMLVIR